MSSNLIHRRDCKEQEALKSAILKEIPEADVEFMVGEDGKLNTRRVTKNISPFPF